MLKVKKRRGALKILCPQPPLIEIPVEEGDGDGGCVCFICDRTMGRGEPFIYLDRQLEVREAGEGEPKVVYAGASLQACLPCTLLSGSNHRLEWASKPKLTEAEIWGFYTYARLLVEAISRNRWDTRVQRELLGRLARKASYYYLELDRVALLGGTWEDISPNVLGEGHCLRCHRSIDFSKPHVALEIAINIPWRDGLESYKPWRLGEYCCKCSCQLLPLEERLW